MLKSKGMVIGALVLLCAICLGGVLWNSTKNQTLPGDGEPTALSGNSSNSLGEIGKIIYESEEDLTIETLSSIEEMPLSETENFIGISSEEPDSEENISTSEEAINSEESEHSHTHEDTADTERVVDRTEGSTEVSDDPEAGHTHEDTAETTVGAEGSPVPLDTIIPIADGSTVLYFSTVETTPEGRVEDMKQIVNDLSAICYYPTEITYFGQFKEGYVYQIFLQADIEAAK